MSEIDFEIADILIDYEKQHNWDLQKVKKGSSIQYKRCLKPEIRNGNYQQITVFDNMKVM